MVVNNFGTSFSNAKKYSIFLPAHALGAFFGSVPRSGIAAMAESYCSKEAKAAPVHERSPAA
jgi:hypothetical protein